jgi:hypothetical protein
VFVNALHLDKSSPGLTTQLQRGTMDEDMIGNILAPAMQRTSEPKEVTGEHNPSSHGDLVSSDQRNSSFHDQHGELLGFVHGYITSPETIS